MAGEQSLDILLRTMAPRLHAEPFGFGSLEAGAPVPEAIAVFALIAEDEGRTVVAPLADLARAGLAHEAGWARISLQVHSSLDAVGLTASVATALAAEGISANVIAGRMHDHIFVPWDRRLQAMAVLVRLGNAA